MSNLRRELGADRLQQVARRMRDLLDSGVERLLVLARRDAVSADLTHELERGGAHLVVCRWLFWTAESLDTAAHAPSIRQRFTRTFGARPSASGSAMLWAVNRSLASAVVPHAPGGVPQGGVDRREEGSTADQAESADSATLSFRSAGVAGRYNDRRLAPLRRAQVPRVPRTGARAGCRQRPGRLRRRHPLRAGDR